VEAFNKCGNVCIAKQFSAFCIFCVINVNTIKHGKKFIGHKISN